jgi:D-sedoheptulose 7-phosphate isomerase
MTVDPKPIQDRLEKTAAAFSDFAQKRSQVVAEIAQLVADTYRAGNKVLIFGNGGSAAEAQHIAAELVNRMCKNRAPLSAIALTTDASVVTSIANDFDFQQIFSKQVEAHGKPGDLAWGLSTSGRSPNVNLALQAARRLGLKTAGMTGAPGFIQEIHLAASHLICVTVENELFPEA